MAGRVSLFFSTRKGLEGPLLRELKNLPCLAKVLAAAPRAAAAAANATAAAEEPLGGGPEPHDAEGPRCLPSPGGVLLKNVPVELAKQLCCGVRTAECVWLRVWGPVRCSTPENLQNVIVKIPWHKYVRPLSALPLLPLRVASIESPIVDSPKLRLALSIALEEAAAAKLPAAAATAAAAEPAAAAAEKALAAAAHRLRIVCVRGQALVDLQLSAPLDPRPYRYLPHLPAAAAAEAAGERPAETPAGAAAAQELQLAASLAELQRRARHSVLASAPSWSLASLVAPAAAGGAPKGPPRGVEGRDPSPQQQQEGGPQDMSRSSCSNLYASNPNAPGSTQGLVGGGGPNAGGPPCSGSEGAQGLSPWNVLPRSAATVSMLRLLYLKRGGAAEALAGAAAADSEAAASAAGQSAAAAPAAGDSATAAEASLGDYATAGTARSPAVWGNLGPDSEEGDVSLAACAAAAGLRRMLRREKRLVLWDPFCGSGSLLLEAALLLGGLPPSSPSVPSAFDVVPAVSTHSEEEQQLQQKGPAAAAALNAGTPQITLVGTDERRVLLHAARHRLRSFCRFYYGGQMPLDLETQQEQLEQQQQHRQLQSMQQLKTEQQPSDSPKPPFAMGLHLASPFDVSQFVSGGVVLTRIPCPREAKRLRSAKGKAFDFYEKFGHMIASRSDWRGVFVIVKGTSFLHYSRLEWEALLNWRDVSGRKLSLLRWTGRKHAMQRLETQAERIAALDREDIERLSLMDD